MGAASQRYNEYLHTIVTVDETWVTDFTPETKKQSMHWRQYESQCRIIQADCIRTEIYVNEFLGQERQSAG